MKTLHLSIIAIAGIITASTVWYFASYDSTPIIQANDFGINALVIHRPFFGCPMTENCTHTDYYLKINSDSKTFLAGYNICDGVTCVKKTGLYISLPVKDPLHPDYLELPLPDNLSWKDGDSVFIMIKAPSGAMNGITISSRNATVWIDLGMSEIVKSS